MPDILIHGARMPELYKPFKVMLAERADGKIVVCVADDDSTAFGAIGEAVELPPHGDMISRDDLLHTMRCHLALYDSCTEDLSLADKSRRDEIQSAISDIFNAPAVIPAESDIK